MGRTVTFQQNIQMNELFQKHLEYVETAKDGTKLYKYTDNMTDEKIAKIVGVHPFTVGKNRKDAYGELKRPSSESPVSQLYSRVATLSEKVASLSDMVNYLTDRIAQLEADASAQSTPANNVTTLQRN